MKRRSKEEKHVSENSIILSGLLLLLLCLLPISAQTRINDFCYYNHLEIGKNYHKIFLYDYSQDSFPDIILLNGNDKEVYELENKSKFLPNEGSNKFFFHTITELSKFNFKSGSGQLFVFLSRKERIAGLLSFTKYGTLQLLNQISFNSYPDKIVTEDINGDGNKESIVCGSNFMGYSILSEKDYTLQEKNYIPDRAFSEVLIFDLDYDSVNDLVFYDLFSSSLVFMYNNEDGEFFEQRSIPLSREAQNLRKYDFNSDGYEDLTFETSEGINFFMGDSVSSFSNIRLVETESEPVDYEVGDFNSDNVQDLAILDSEGILSVMFAISPDSLSVPVKFMKKNNLVDIKSITRKKAKVIYALADDGNMYTLSNISDKSGSFSISACIEPETISSFNYSDSYNEDICFIDNYDSHLKFLLRGNSDEFDTYFEIPINNDFDNIAIASNQKPLTTFYCFKQGEKLLDRIEVDFTEFTYKKDKFYSYQPIQSVEIVSGKEKQNIQLLLYGNGLVSKKSIYVSSDNITIEKVDTLAENVFQPALDSDAGGKLFFWNVTDSTYNLAEKDLAGDNQKSKLYKTFVRDTSKELNIVHKPFPAGSSNPAGTYGIVANMRDLLYYFKENKFEYINIKSNLKKGSSIRYKDIIFYKNNKGKEKQIYLNDSVGNNLFYMNIGGMEKDKYLTHLFENIYINTYFVADLFFQQVNLVYTDYLENCITIRRIE